MITWSPCRMKWTRDLVLVYVNVLLYALCFQFQKPIEPYLVDKLGHGKGDAGVAYAWLQTFFGLVQVPGSFVMGLVLDRYGTRAGYVAVFLGSAASYAIMGVATNMWILYLSKVPAALQHAFLVSQTMVAQVSSEEDRAEALGLLMTAYTIGASIGPLIGGMVGDEGDYYTGAWLATAGSLLSVYLSLLMPAFPGRTEEHTSGKDAHEPSEVVSGRPLTPWDGLKRVIGNPIVLSLLGTKLLTTIANSLYRSANAIIFKEKFHVKPGGQGLQMSLMSACNALSGAFIVGPVSRRFSTGNLVIGCLLWMAACFGGMAITGPSSSIIDIARTVVPHMHASVPHISLAIAQSMAAFAMATGLTALSTRQVEDGLKGTLMGVEHGVFSMTSVGIPSLGILLLRKLDIFGMCTLCGCMLLAVVIIWQSVAAPRIRMVEAEKTMSQELQEPALTSKANSPKYE
mmetsp:Transcript_25640/g.59742  ORF Transcript_25640/g.59742 Transcript_25640/m.59742 type:complete len:457 (+) Transcript_25640:52-1422(+)